MSIASLMLTQQLVKLDLAGELGPYFAPACGVFVAVMFLVVGGKYRNDPLHDWMATGVMIGKHTATRMTMIAPPETRMIRLELQHACAAINRAFLIARHSEHQDIHQPVIPDLLRLLEAARATLDLIRELKETDVA